MLFSIVLAAFSATLSFARPISRSLNSTDDQTNNATVTVLSTNTVNTFHTHALLAQAAYCADASAALPNVNMLLLGGDGGSIPRFFVGHDPATNSIVVAHEGTSSDNPFSIAIDAQFILAPLNTTLFPNSPAGIEVHEGFGETFALTANSILPVVQKGLQDNNANNVLVSGHSLGAALAVMTSIFLKEQLDTASQPVNISTAVFGLPRAGNQAWADFVDANLPDLRHMHNQHDLVPTIPPRFLDYQHPSGELFIQPEAPNNVVFCPGQEDENCSEGNDLVDADIAMHKGPYVGLLMGRSHCPVLNATLPAS